MAFTFVRSRSNAAIIISCLLLLILFHFYETLENVPTALQHASKINRGKKLENVLYLTEGYHQLDYNTTARQVLYFTSGVLKFFGQGQLDLL